MCGYATDTTILVTKSVGSILTHDTVRRGQCVSHTTQRQTMDDVLHEHKIM